MSSGLPVVAILAGGIKENLIDGYNGLACYKNDSREFSQKLEHLINNKDLRQTLALNARQHALKQTWDQVFEKLLVSYRKVLDVSYRYNRMKKYILGESKGRFIS